MWAPEAWPLSARVSGCSCPPRSGWSLCLCHGHPRLQRKRLQTYNSGYRASVSHQITHFPPLLNEIVLESPSQTTVGRTEGKQPHQALRASPAESSPRLLLKLKHGLTSLHRLWYWNIDDLWYLIFVFLHRQAPLCPPSTIRMLVSIRDGWMNAISHYPNHKSKTNRTENTKCSRQLGEIGTLYAVDENVK